MVSAVELLLAAAPLLIAGVLMVGFLWSATRAMPIAWISAVVIGFAVWGMPGNWVAAASINGVITALTILWIVFGALLLLYTLQEAGAFDRINEGFAAVSDDRRVQIVLLGFFLATFIEGAAGFGTPAAVVAPLLLALGFPALAAVIAAIIGHIIAVTYGAVGTPIIIGIENPLGVYEEAITAGGYASVTEFSNQVAAWAATYHALIGFMMPFIGVLMIVHFFGDDDTGSLGPALEVAPLCLFAGISFAIPYWVSAWYITAEFPSLIGSMVGGAITVGVLRAGYLLPDSHWDFPPRSEWKDHWVGTIEPGSSNGGRAAADGGTQQMSLAKAWVPYILVVVLLVITRAVGPVSSAIGNADYGVEVGNFTIGIVLGWSNILGTEISNSIAWMSVPGFWLIVPALLSIPIFGMSGGEFKSALSETASKLVSPFIALIFVIAMVQVMLQSAVAPTGIDLGMIQALAQATANALGPAYPFVAALIGALGAAMAGSNTVSNITFGGFQFEAAQQLGLPTQLIVGAQAVGGAIGNLIAIHNVVAALATVGLVGQEGRVMRLNLLPLLYYSIGVGLLAMLFSYVLFPGLF
ncbi:LctP family transport protein [Natronomonas moolapensis 8.8.11]|uniref:LctP family transport protein n=1 Tax=Natronomonas moolapensis (strain DSM 18674 / CECT 7526 / JCM 14361 / 8.8.11) TaxID=268739 RepID=M1XNE1_NATM8|nr:L-lactate permease [Natronomonas moolapensis]CCQ35415.1 LctP family transport protein [Natronomonas moolapensis 8.8.11]